VQNSSDELAIERSVADQSPSSETVLSVANVSKRYEIYERPQDRLKQSIVPRLQTALLPLSMRRSRPYYKEFWALRDVSFQLKRGEALGILGRNGAGKSTLLQIIAGTLTPTSGAVAVRGKVAALLELGSGFSPDFTGDENVRLNATLLGLDEKTVSRKFDEIAAFADIGDFIDQPVKTYSSGMMLRLAFAVQTAVEPDLLIVDEALSVGDASFQKKCFRRLEQLRERGTTILFVTHDTGTVVQFCSQALVLEGGKIFTSGMPQAVARRYHRLLFEGVNEVSGAANEGSQVHRSARKEAETLSESLRAADLMSQAHDGLMSPSSLANVVSDPAAKLSVSARQTDDGASSAGPGSGREVRYGNREAEIVEIGLRDMRGVNTRLIEVHSTYEFYFRVRFNADIHSPIGYGFIISNSRGVEIFATKAGLHGTALPASPEGTAYECSFTAAIPIVPGTYFLSVAVAHEEEQEKGQFLDCRFDAFEFQIVGMTRAFTTCLVDLDVKLSERRWIASSGKGRTGSWESQ